MCIYAYNTHMSNAKQATKPSVISWRTKKTSTGFDAIVTAIYADTDENGEHVSRSEVLTTVSDFPNRSRAVTMAKKWKMYHKSQFGI